LSDNVVGCVEGGGFVYQAVDGGARVRAYAKQQGVKDFNTNGPKSQQTTQTITKVKTATLKTG
jgi:hypothetical protein